MNPTVIAQDVRKSFTCGDHGRRIVEVLKGVSLSVCASEMVAIVGPSGSGKSTLLYCLAGLEAADSGIIEVMGHRLDGASRRSVFKTRRDHMGFVFQSYNLIPSLSVGENVSLPARLSGRPLSLEETRAALDSVGLSGRGRDRMSGLSGGEQQRVAVARVLAAGPDVVFADEPTGALDSRNGREVLGMLRKICEDPHRSVVMVTHNLDAASLADRVLVLEDGRVVEELGHPTAARIFDAMEGRR